MSNKLINTTTLGYFKTKEDELIKAYVDRKMSSIDDTAVMTTVDLTDTINAIYGG